MEEKVRIPQHKHCRHCGKAFTGEGYGDRFCSEDCFSLEGSEARKKLKKYALMIVVLWAVVGVAVLLVGF